MREIHYTAIEFQVPTRLPGSNVPVNSADRRAYKHLRLVRILDGARNDLVISDERFPGEVHIPWDGNVTSAVTEDSASVEVVAQAKRGPGRPRKVVADEA